MNNSQTHPANDNKKSGIYYGYFIVASCFLIMVLVYGSQASFGVFFKPMLNEFGWTRASTSGPASLYMLISGLLSMVAGKLSEKYGTRLVVTVGGILIGVGYILMSGITNMWQLYLYYGVLAAVGASTIYVPLVSMIARWFTSRRGLMSGIGIAGLGFGIGVVPAIASQLMVSFSWRTSILILGVTVLVLVVLFAQMLKDNPESGKMPVADARSQSRALRSDKNYTFKEAYQSIHFWVIFIAWFLYGFFFQVGIVHIVPYATDIGMAAVAAATILTVIGIVGTFGRISLGYIGDRMGNMNTISISFAIIGLAFLGLSLSSSIGVLYLFAAVFGLLSGVGILLIPTIAEHYGIKHLGAISGAFVFANNLGGTVSPPLVGGIFDIMGHYTLGFIICGVLGIIAGAMIWYLRPIRKKTVHQKV